VPGHREDSVGSIRLLRTNPDFAKLFAAQVISFAGDWFATVALLGLVLELTGSAIAGSLVIVAQLLPIPLAAPLAGLVVDRLDRRKVMVAADLARVGLALGILLARDEQTVWIAFACAAGIAALAAVFEPAVNASVPNLVSERELPTASVLMGSTWGTMLALGAALGGVVASVFGRDIALVVNAASFAASALLVLSIRRPMSLGRSSPRGTGSGREAGAAAGRPRVALVGELREVFGYARARRRVLALLLVKVGVGVGNGVVVLLALYAERAFHAGDIGIGVLLSARGLGALVGPFVARRPALGRPGRFLPVVGTAIVLYGLAYFLLPLMPGIGVAAVVVFLAHLGGGAQWTLSNYGLQHSVPDVLRGRVFALDFGLVTLVIAASTLLAGWATEHVGLAATTVTLSAFSVVYGLWWLAWTRPLWPEGVDSVLEPVPAELRRAG
jgi:MFS family permease